MDDWVLRTSYWFIHKADQLRIGALKAINNFLFEAIVIFLSLHVKKMAYLAVAGYLKKKKTSVNFYLLFSFLMISCQLSMYICGC